MNASTKTRLGTSLVLCLASCGLSLVLINAVGSSAPWHGRRPTATRRTIKVANFAEAGHTVTPATPRLVHKRDLLPEAPIALAHAVAIFPRSFEEDLIDDDTTMAGAVFDAYTTSPARQTATLYAVMKPYMDAHDFLWHRPSTVALYWSACIAAACDRSTWLSQHAVHNPSDPPAREIPTEVTDSPAAWSQPPAASDG